MYTSHDDLMTSVLKFDKNLYSNNGPMVYWPSNSTVQCNTFGIRLNTLISQTAYHLSKQKGIPDSTRFQERPTRRLGYASAQKLVSVEAYVAHITRSYRHR